MYDEEGNLMSPASDEGFFSAARSRVSSFLDSAQAFGQSPAGSQLFNAIYQYGRGRIDSAREKAVGAFLMTSEGKKVQASATRQTLVQYAPAIALGVLAVIFAVMFFTRK